MHRVKVNISILFFLIASTLYGVSTFKNVKILELTEDIKFTSQEIAKEYFYTNNTKFKRDKTSLNKIVLDMDDKLRILSRLTKSTNTRNMLEFLILNNEEISNIISKPYSLKNASLIIEYSEIILESARFLNKENSYNFSSEENMLIGVRNMAYLLERINKYYVAYHLGFDSNYNTKELNKAIDDFDKELNKLDNYNYESHENSDYKSIVSLWKSVRLFFYREKSRNLSNIVYLSTNKLENLIDKLAIYHSKNQ